MTETREPLPLERPAAGHLREDDSVFVHGRGGKATPARVVKAARVWLTIEAPHARGHHLWRMRRDTQNEGTDSMYQARFVTPAQHQYDERLREANDYLFDQGIELRPYSPWREPHRRVALADLIRSAGES